MSIRLVTAHSCDTSRASSRGSTFAPGTGEVGGRPHTRVALWHACTFYPREVRVLSERETYAVAVQRGDTLHLLDLAAPRRFDLLPVLPRLIREPIARVRFGFCPELWCPTAHVVDRSDDALFIRGALELSAEPFKLPMLAHT
jgi:hypothetical protein